MKLLFKILLPIAVVAVGLGVRSWLLANAPQAPTTLIHAAPPLVEIVEVALSQHVLEVEAYGELQPERELALAAEVGGRVIWMAPELNEGASFLAGHALIRVDPTDAEQALSTARAERARAAAALALEQATTESALQDWAELGIGEASALARREPQLALAAAGLQAADSMVERAATALSRCEVRAPFTGTCRQRLVVVGAVIAPGTPLARIQSTQRFEARLVLSRVDMESLGMSDSRLEVPISVQLTALSLSERPSWQARVERFEPALDARDRTARAIASLELGPEDPIPFAGTFVRARLLGRTVQAVAELPRSALRPDGSVWVVDANSRLHGHPVEVVATTPTGVLVRGLAQGVRVCVSALGIAAEGMPVSTGQER